MVKCFAVSIVMLVLTFFFLPVWWTGYFSTSQKVMSLFTLSIWIRWCCAWIELSGYFFVLNRRSGGTNADPGREYTGRVSSYEQQQRAFRRAEKLQDGLDPNNPSFVKTMVRSHVSSCFWLVSSKMCNSIPWLILAQSTGSTTNQESIVCTLGSSYKLLQKESASQWV